MSFRAVLFDWRGTLVPTLTERAWVDRRLHHVTALCPAPAGACPGVRAG